MKSSFCNSIEEQFDSSIYQLLEKIGEGGFGRVYRAKQIKTEQIVAIKFLSINPDFDIAKKARYRERFERETLLSSRLQHPNIVRLLDKGNCADQLYIVFEYVDGKTLKETLAESGTLSAVETAEIMAQVLDALAHAHQQGVIHRDIKPANIMLSKNGTKTHAMVLDFGIGTLVNEARLLDYKSITLSQETLGTPAYSAPEQLRGEPPTLKSDLYVWGLVFIECLTGQAAMSGSSMAAIFHKQLSKSNVPLPASIVGHPIATLLRRVLQKKTDQRNINTQELYRELVNINFSNLVGIIPAVKPYKISQDISLHMPVFDKTVVHGRAVHPIKLTERKQITVLSLNVNAHIFSDEKSNDEMLDTMLRDQKNICIDMAIRYGGYHVGSLANSLLFYFGYPLVSDNDCRLCARSALDIISSLHKRNALLKVTQGIELNARIGIHTGLVTCYADAVPEGNTVNIAMRLALLADKDSILCSDSSQKMLQTYIEFEPVKSHLLETSAREMALFNLIGERHVEAFGFLRGIQNNHHFIGREVELNKLNALLSHSTKSTEAYKLVHIYGEAGIGKSRLIFELRSKETQRIHYVAQCLPEHRNNALYPILNIIKYKYSLDSLDPNQATKKLYDELKKHHQPEKEVCISVLCAWLGLPLIKEIQIFVQSPEQQKRILFETLITLLLSSECSQDAHGNLFVFEDMHWSDPTSIEFIVSLSRDKAFINSNHLFISTSRQPLPTLLKQSRFQLLHLVKLTQQKTREFVRILFANEHVSSDLLDLIVARTDGIPLFVEELVDMLKQKGLVHKLNGIFDFTSPDKLDEVPSSLRGSLQQKLDTLIYAKETIQLAATIGREFDYDLLIAASNDSEADVQNDLIELIKADLIYQQRKVTGDSYIFKHALVRDAAYESMLNDARICMHNLVATAIESKFPQRIEKIPFTIANHFAKAKCFAKAVELGIKSANQAITQSGERYAISISAKSLKWNRKIENLVIKYENELALNSVMIPALMVASDSYAPKELQIIMERSQKILNYFSDCEQAEVSDKIKEYSFNFLWALYLFHNNRSERSEPLRVAEKMLDVANEYSYLPLIAFATAVVGYCHWTDGECQKGIALLEHSLQLYEQCKEDSYKLVYKFGLDCKSWALAILSLAYWSTGFSVKANQSIKESEEWATYINHIGNLSYTRACKCILLQHQGERAGVIETYERQQQDENKFGIQFIATIIGLIRDWAIGSTEYSLSYLDNLWQSGIKHWQPMLESIFIISLQESKQFVLSLERLEVKINWCIEGGDSGYIARLYMLKAIALFNLNDNSNSQAVDYFNASLEQALQQGLLYQAMETLVYGIELIHSESQNWLNQLQEIMTKLPPEHSSSLLDKARELLQVNT